jgi:hypothetical protein
MHEDELNAGLLSYSILLFIEVIDTATRLHGAAIYVTKIKNIRTIKLTLQVSY